MNKIVQYDKDHSIEARPDHLKTGKWTTKIYIHRKEGSNTVMTEYSAANQFDTEEEAVKYCFLFGKKIIEGDIQPEKIG